MRGRGYLTGPCLLGLVLFLLAGFSLGTLSFTLAVHDVQDLDRAVRKPPSLAPVVPAEKFQVEAGSSNASVWAHLLPRISSLFGHDDLGRSLLFRVLLGSAISFGIGLTAAIVAVVVGTLWGATAGLLGGWVDRLLMRILDVLYALPYVLTAILLQVALTRPLRTLMGENPRLADLVVLLLAIGGVSWLTLARVVRGQILSLRSRPFVEAARVLGAGPFRIFWFHLLPNLAGPIIACATLLVPQAIMQEAFLSFLGIGIQPPLPSLGRLAAEGVEAVNMFVGYWWLIVFPCGVLVFSLVALNVIGDAVQRALVPASRGSILRT